MEIIMQLLVLGSVFFVYYDASRHKIGKIPNEKGFFNMSAGMWAVGTLLLWIVAFPAYLIKRNSLIRKAKEVPQEPSLRGLKLGIIGAFFGLVLLGNLAWVSGSAPLPLDNEAALISAMESINNEMVKMASKMAVDLQGKKGSPKDMKKLLEEAFSRAGYSYSETLHKMASEGINVMSSDAQIATFLLLPLLQAGGDVSPEAVYSGQELQDVQVLISMLK